MNKVYSTQLRMNLENEQHKKANDLLLNRSNQNESISAYLIKTILAYEGFEGETNLNASIDINELEERIVNTIRTELRNEYKGGEKNVKEELVEEIVQEETVIAEDTMNDLAAILGL